MFTVNSEDILNSNGWHFDPNVDTGMLDFMDQIGTGIQNWWYKNTGQAHLTSEYQHEEQLANTAYQRAAADMASAGLSKFGGVNPASSPSPKSGAGLLSTALAASQLKGQLISNSENIHNLNIAKKWNIPTSAVGEVAKYDAISKFLFGKGIMDIVGDDGVFGLIQDWLKGVNPETEPGEAAVVSAAVDEVQHMNTDVVDVLEPVYSSIFGDSQVYKPAPMELPSIVASAEKYEPLKFTPFSSKNFKRPTPEQTATYVIGSDVKKDVDAFMKKMLNDGKLTDDNMKKVAYSVGLRYGKDSEDILKYMHDWIKANDGEIIYVWGR